MVPIRTIIMKLSVCVETVFTDCRLSQRVVAIRECGVDWFELWGLDSQKLNESRELVNSHKGRLALFCGNRNYSLTDPSQRPNFLQELAENLHAAQSLGCPALTILSDAVDSRGIPIRPAKSIPRTARLNSLHDGLVAALELAAPTGVRLCIEPLNSTLDHPGYTLDQPADAFEIVQTIGNESLRVLFDVYHAQMMRVNVVGAIENNMELIGHIHIADVPGRHEPGTGKIDFSQIAQVLINDDYQGSVGLECFPLDESDQAVRAFVKVFEPFMAIPH